MKMKGLEMPEKAYKNLAFLNSPDAREIRVLCEFIEPRTRLRKYNVRDTVVFYGSARIKAPEEARRAVREAEARVRRAPRSRAAREQLEMAQRQVEMSRYYADAVELSRLLTEWSIRERDRALYVCSGGGPGIMEAANRGARLVKGGRCIGFNISLPYEQRPNPYITPELNFNFHYFFIRKFWFVYLAKALVIFPGGYGTLDELFELLTLVQTGKTKKAMPIVIYGTEYWNKVLHFEPMAEYGMIDKRDLKLFRYCDTPQEAFAYLKTHLAKVQPVVTL
ncbi:MAG: LOG family protein [bacterium]|nr:LOG family protein [bacterium]